MSSVRSAVASASAVPVSLLALLVALAGSATAQSGIPGPAAVHSGIPGPAAAQSGTPGPAAAQSGTSADASYYVRDVATGRCLAGTRIATCGSDGTEWVLRGHGDGTVQFQQAGFGAQGPSPRCLTLPAMQGYPAAVRMSACDAPASTASSAESAHAASPAAPASTANSASPAASAHAASPDSADSVPDAGRRADRWRIEGWVDGPVTIAHAYPPAGRLFVAGSAVRVSNNSSAMWVLDPLVTVKARR